MSTSPSPSVAPLDIVEEYFEQLDFLGELRERHVFAPHWTLRELGDVEERCEAHVDGLRLAGDVAIELARSGLAAGESGAAAAAARLFLTLDRPELSEEILHLFTTGAPPVSDGIRIAMRHCEIGPIEAKLRILLSSDRTALRVAAADVLTFHRRPVPAEVDFPVRDPDPYIATLACAVIGRRGGPWSREDLEAALATDDPQLRRVALTAAAKLGMPNLADTCRRAAFDSRNPVAEALEFVGVLGNRSDLPLLAARLGEPPVAAAAMAGLGALGCVEAVPVLIDAMFDSSAKQEAGAAFLRITAAVLGARPRGTQSPTTNEDDAPEAGLDPERARSFWKERESQFDPGARWQAGVAVEHFPERAVFDALPLQIRQAVWLGARALRLGGTPDLELEASAALQRGSS